MDGLHQRLDASSEKNFVGYPIWLKRVFCPLSIKYFIIMLRKNNMDIVDIFLKTSYDLV